MFLILILFIYKYYLLIKAFKYGDPERSPRAKSRGRS